MEPLKNEIANNKQSSMQLIQIKTNQPSSSKSVLQNNKKTRLDPIENENPKDGAIQFQNVSSVITDHYYTIIHKKPRLTAADSTKDSHQPKKQKIKKSGPITSSTPNPTLNKQPKLLPKPQISQSSNSAQEFSLKQIKTNIPIFKTQEMPQVKTLLLKTDEAKAMQKILLNSSALSKVYNEQKKTYKIAPAIFKSNNDGTVQIRSTLTDDITGALKNIRSSTIIAQTIDNDKEMMHLKKELSERNKQLHDLRNEFKNSVDALTKDKIFYQNQCEMCRKSERQMMEELTKSQKENSTFKKEIQRLFEESCTYQQELHDKFKELENLKEMIIEKDIIIEKKNKQLADVRVEFKDSMEILTRDKAFYQNQCELSQDSKSKIGQNLIEVQTENVTLKNEIKRLYDECCAHQVKIHEQAKESENLKEIIIEKDISINNLEKCNDAMKKTMKAIEQLCR